MIELSIWKTIWLIACLWCVTGAPGEPTAPAVPRHVYEDGFIERSLSITVRDGVAYGECLIGLNRKTADQVLRQAQLRSRRHRSPTQQPPPASGLPLHPPNLPAHQRTTIDALPNPRQRLPSAAKLATPDLSASGNQHPLATGAEGRSSRTQPPTGDRAGRSAEEANPAQRNQPPINGPGQHLTSPDVIQHFADVNQYWFEDGIQVTVDQRPVKLTAISVTPAPRHPFSMAVKFQFLVTRSTDDDQAVNLKVTDRLFPGQAGAVKHALKVRGDTILLNSNVAPVLVRAKRFQHKATCGQDLPSGVKPFSIEAKMIVPAS